MNRKILSLILTLIIIIGAFAGCGPKAKTTPQETLDAMTAAGFPLELIPEGVEAEFNSGVVLYATQYKSFDELTEFYKNKIKELGAVTTVEYGTQELLEKGMIEQAYIDAKLESWLYNGVVGEKNLYINIEQRQVQLNTTTVVYVAYDKTQEDLHTDEVPETTPGQVTEIVPPATTETSTSAVPETSPAATTESSTSAVPETSPATTTETSTGESTETVPAS